MKIQKFGVKSKREERREKRVTLSLPLSLSGEGMVW
jgi:hypothetical protein